MSNVAGRTGELVAVSGSSGSESTLASVDGTGTAPFRLF